MKSFLTTLWRTLLLFGFILCLSGLIGLLALLMQALGLFTGRADALYAGLLAVYMLICGGGVFATALALHDSLEREGRHE